MRVYGEHRDTFLKMKVIVMMKSLPINGPSRKWVAAADGVVVIEEGVIKEGVIEEGVIKEGVIEEGVIKEGVIEEEERLK